MAKTIKIIKMLNYNIITGTTYGTVEISLNETIIQNTPTARAFEIAKTKSNILKKRNRTLNIRNK